MNKSEELREQLAEARATELEILTCKTFGHAWSIVGRPEHYREIIGGVRLFLRCDRCGTRRTDLFTHFGRLNGRSYSYDPRYRDTWRFATDEVYTAREQARSAWALEVGIDD